MYQKLRNLMSNSFIKSTGILFLVNNLNNLLNYVLIVVVISLLGNDFGVWVSTTGFLALLSVPISSLMSILTSKFSRLAENNPQNAYNFYLQFIKLVRNFRFQIIAVMVGALIITNYSLKFESLSIPTLLIISVLASLFAGINQNFLLGVLEIKKYSFGVIIGAISKFIITIGLIKSGVGVESLPLGLIISFTLTILYSNFCISKHFQNNLTTEIANIEEIKSSLLIDGKNTIKATLYFIILSLFLNVDVVLSRSFLNQAQNNQYALISTFGLIAHFGPISMTSLLVPYASRKNHQNVIYLSNLAIIVAGVFISLFYFTFASIILTSLGKTADYNTSWLIFLYSLFIMMYNLIFININYLISRLNFKLIITLMVAITVFITSFIIIATSSFAQNNRIMFLIYSNIFLSTIPATYLVIYNLKKNS